MKKMKRQLGGSPGLVVMGDDSCLRGHGFESRHRILNGHDIFYIDLLLKMYCLFGKTKINKKEARVVPFLKFHSTADQLVSILCLKQWLVDIIMNAGTYVMFRETVLEDTT